jgi:ABC-type amino acid transport substrate-binding protein
MIAAAVLALSTGFAAAQTVRMGTEGAYPPYNFINDAGEVDGFERELGDELCKRAGLTCEWVTTDWDSIIPNLQSGNYDTIIAGMNINEERSKVISFTQNYTPPAPSAYVALSADADIEGGVIAAQVNTIQSGYIASSGVREIFTAAALLVVLLHANAPEVWFWFAALLVLLLWRSFAWRQRRWQRLQERQGDAQEPPSTSGSAPG